ncbi:MAG: Na+/H+ antiporter NhaA, partial [Nitrobacter sp.]
LLCGIGFTMSLFIGLLAFDDPALQNRVKFGILAGSLIAGVMGYAVLRVAHRRKPSPAHA